MSDTTSDKMSPQLGDALFGMIWGHEGAEEAFSLALNELIDRRAGQVVDKRLWVKPTKEGE